MSNKLEIKWSKKEKDLMIHYPRRCDGVLIAHHICEKVCVFDFIGYAEGKKYPYEEFHFIDELKRRGYDISTLKFSIELLPEPPKE